MEWKQHHTALLSIVAVSDPLIEEARPFAPAECVVPTAVGEDIGGLTGRLASGDDEAFREFHRLYFDRLYRLMLVLCQGMETEAREALQETVCRVARHARKFDREDVFWCWLVAIGRSAVRDAGRKRHRYWKLLANYALRWLPIQNQPAEEQDEHLASLLAECLNELDPADRALVEGKYISHLSMTELARHTGLTPRAVESRLFRLRGLLRKRLLSQLRKDPL